MRVAVLDARLLIALGAVTLAACGGSRPGLIGADGERREHMPSPREERVLLTQFNEISALAASQRHLFVATPFGLGVMDRQFNRWLPPVTVADGYPQEQATALAADPASDAVWVGGIGVVIIYRPSVDVLTRIPLSGMVEQIVFHRGSGDGYVRASGSWYRISFAGLVTRISPRELPPANQLTASATLDDVYREFPMLRSFERLMLRDSNLRNFPVTAGTRSPERSEVWLGTWGDGVFQIDPLFQQATHRPFGLMDRGAGAIARAADGIFVAGLGIGVRPRGGITFASTELQTWRWMTGPVNNPLIGSRALALATREDIVWLGTDRGLARMSTRNENDLEFWTALNGLPSDPVLSIAPRHGGVWVGTTRGLAFVSDTARRGPRNREVSQTLADGTPIRALLLTGDTLWVGTDGGLLLLPPGGDNRLVLAAAADTEQRLKRPIRALARNDSLVAIATENDVILIEIHTGRLRPRLDFPGAGTVRDIRSLAMDENTILIGGGFGAIMIRMSDGLTRTVRPSGVYNEVEDMVLTNEYVWLATPDGVTRLRRTSDGSVY